MITYFTFPDKIYVYLRIFRFRIGYYVNQPNGGYSKGLSVWRVN